MAQNRGTLRGTIRLLLGETTASFWSDAILNQWMDDGMLDICLKTKCNKAYGYITVVEDIIEYTLSDYITDFLDVSGPVRIYDGTNLEWRKKMRGTSQDEMDLIYPGWEKSEQNGEPTLYWFDQELDRWWVFQPPSAQYSGTEYLKIPYSRKPAATATDSSEPDVPSTLYQAIIEYVLARGNESRGYSDIAGAHWGSYGKAIQAYISLGKPNVDQDVVMKNYRNVRHSGS
jgi:hypothetical protein